MKFSVIILEITYRKSLITFKKHDTPSFLEIWNTIGFNYPSLLS